jgi:hypothetical protein
MLTVLGADRLQYLLNQSDIFSHFGVGKKEGDTHPPPESPARPSASSTRDHRQKGTARDELDADEQEMLDEEAEDGDNGGSPRKNAAALGSLVIRQPSLVVGGAMR